MDAGPKGKKELTSWKEIANFLGVSERTAQNWEQKQGLPVQRLPGVRGRVLADPAELENWKKTAVLKQTNGHTSWQGNSKFVRIYAVLITVLVLIGVGIVMRSFFAANKPGPPASYHINFKTFVVTDAAGAVVWKASLPEPFYQPRYAGDPTNQTPVCFEDIDGDSRIETLFLYDPANRDNVGCTLICYSNEGVEKWRFVPGGTVADVHRTYSPPFIIANFLVADPNRDGAKEILVTSHHLSDHPNQFVILDGTGKKISEYWHSGFLESMDICDLDGDGVDEILLADVNNGYWKPTLVVLDPRHVAGASTQPEGDEHQLQKFELGKEKAVVLFPRSCINLLSGDRNVARLLTVGGGQIRIEVIENRYDRACSIIYTLNRNLTPTDIAVSDRFKSFHHELQMAGKLNHAFSDQEAEQLKKQIRVIRYPAAK